MRAASPTPRLAVGLMTGMVAVIAFFWYTNRQLERLLTLQTSVIDRNQHDAAQLLRFQNDLSLLSQLLREAARLGSLPPEAKLEKRLAEIRRDMEGAAGPELATLGGVDGGEWADELRNRLRLFWASAGRMLELAGQGRNSKAQQVIEGEMLPSLGEIHGQISRLLAEKQQENKETALAIRGIYYQVGRNLDIFLGLMLTLMGASGLYVIRANRRLFEQVSRLSEQRRILAARLFTLQEDVLKSVSRELHDEFGQILTAAGALLHTMERTGLALDSPLRSDLLELKGILQEGLDKVRSLSHALRPTLLDDYGLLQAVESHVRHFERLTGIRVHFERGGLLPALRDEIAIHVFRILQEAMNNAARHAGVKEIWVRLATGADQLRLEVEDHGGGMPPAGKREGLGLIAMRERADLIGARLRIDTPSAGGTLVALEVPLEPASSGRLGLTQRGSK